MIEKPRYEWTAEDRRKANLDDVTKDICTLRCTINVQQNQMCTTAKETGKRRDSFRKVMI
ncbi:hypothetical protein F511_47697 [Dorcoceras hygrometricum]|uniref:Uncharacterized protein n=1 Tax=Dorcoceras hygrometricum TaxID=472368 RepID=A0A2Z6ZWL3_9LAMI|nr:hypothetical protein F511_47697 [Dorcoceras hygrometricum]